MLRADPTGAALQMRVGFRSRTQLQDGLFVSTHPIALPNDGAWHALSFSLAADEMSSAGGALTHDEALAHVEELRIFSSSEARYEASPPVFAIFGLDNVQALPEPATAMLLGVGVLIVLRRTCRDA